MRGAITNLEDLEKWFKGNNYPHFILAYANGKGENQILKNEGDGALTDIEEAWEMLRDMIEAQVRSGRAILEVKVFPKGGKYHPLRTQIDMSLPGQGFATYPNPAIGNLPNSGITETKLSEVLAEERRKWEMEKRIEELEDKINGPANTWERAAQLIGEYPVLGNLVQTFVAGIMNMPGVSATIAGTPGAGTMPGNPAPPDHDEQDPNEVFSINVHQASQALGVDPVTMAVRLNQLVQNNPEIAKQLLNNNDAGY